MCQVGKIAAAMPHPRSLPDWDTDTRCHNHFGTGCQMVYNEGVAPATPATPG